ncbi:MAG: Nif3-like dinuclear metal center hexameric protein [Bacteroidales bacterium]|jgi:dinuclear metal center YbgI/SA1388 family protein
MKLSELITYLEEIAPLSLQESYDNSGLLIGAPDKSIHKALLSLDVTSEVVEEAVTLHCDVIIAHHPLIFKGIKKLTGSNDTERSILKAIKADIAIYAIHTNLDNVFHGVNNMLAGKLGLRNLKILSAKYHQLKKIVTFCPVDQANQVREAMFNAGAGTIGNYDHCSFNQQGTGTFKGNENTDPYVGKPGSLHEEAETRIETIVPAYLVKPTILAMIEAHPYEEVAYDIYPLENKFEAIGSGMVGELAEPIPARDFLLNIKKALGCEYIKHNKLVDRQVLKVAVCGGSGSFLIDEAYRAKADVFVTGDIKYHEYYEHFGQMTIVDAGHFETEQGIKELLEGLITKKFPNFALRISKKNINPVSFL